VNNQAKDFLLLGSGKILRMPLAVLVMALLSRLIGPDGIGKWSMLVAISTFFHTLLLNWTQAPFVRFGCEEWEKTNKLSQTWSARKPLIFSGIAITVLLIALQPFAFFETLTSLPSSWWPFAVLYFLALWCSAETQSILTITKKFKYLAITPLLVDSCLILLLLYIFLMGDEALKSWTIIGLVILTALLWAIMWGREFIRTHSNENKAYAISTRQIIIFGWPMIPTFGLGYLSDWGDHFLLQHFHGAQQVGFFHAGYQIVVGMMALAAPLSVIFLPQLIERKSLDENAEFDYLSRIVPAVATLWLIGIMPCIAMAPWVFDIIFGESFSEAHEVLYVLCTAIPGAVFSSLNIVLFNAQGRLGQTGIFIAIMFFVNIVISLWLIPEWGSLGAAIGTTISFLIGQCCYIFDQHKHLNVPSFKCGILFLGTWLYSVIQIPIGEHILTRIIFAMVSMGIIVFTAKRYKICDGKLVAGLVPRQFAWVARVFD